MQTELSWRAVVIVALLAVLGVVCSLLGEKTLGASLVGGALGYLAQGFARGSSGIPTEIPREESVRKRARPPGATRLQLIPTAIAVGSLWVLIFLG